MFFFDPPDRFVAGTVGEPGHRTFYLQARKASQVVSVVLEKVQVQVLAERLDQLLDELEGRGIAETVSTEGTRDNEPLDEPLVEAFRATTLTLGWDPEAERVLVEARADPVEIEVEIEADDEEDEDPTLADVDAAAVEASGAEAVADLDAGIAASIRAAFEAREADEDEDDDLEAPDVLRVRVSAAAARSFVERAARVVASGRPPCPMCGQPLDPQGHICPRRNGHFVN
jgi:uncharacterized repeat protein (TIGR03847 family)